MRTFLLFILLITAAVGGVSAQTRQLIPTSYESGRFFATPQVGGAGSLRLLVDTGGPSIFGLYGVSDKAAKRLNLSLAPCNVSGMVITTVRPFHGDSGLPAVKGAPCNSVAFVDSRFEATNSEGCLGGDYLMHFIWTFDYPKEQLWHEPDSWKPGAGMHATAMGFVRNKKGGAIRGTPRVTIWMGGQPMDMALVTGAPTFTIKLQPDAQPAYSGSSYLAKSTVDKLLRDHADCCSVMVGNHQNRVIEIKKIKIAGWLIGPIWFAEVPDAYFSSSSPGLGQVVDKPVQGALGPNIFDHFSMTLDYKTDTAWFACVSGCSVVND